MKKIEAIIKPFKLKDVMEALVEAGFIGMTVTEVRGRGRQKGHTELYRGSDYTVDMLPRAQINLTVADDDADRVAGVILRAARTGNTGDGRVTVLPVEQFWNIRTEENEAAVDVHEPSTR